jgi:uncharacterized lipoprotein
MKTVVAILLTVLGIAGCSAPHKQSLEIDRSYNPSMQHMHKQSPQIDRSYNPSMQHMLMAGAEGYAYDVSPPQSCNKCACYKIFEEIYRMHCDEPSFSWGCPAANICPCVPKNY